MTDLPTNRLRRRQVLDQHFRELIEAATSTPVGAGGARSAEGDEARLRGIPAIARGVSGEVPGTRPDRAVG